MARNLLKQNIYLSKTKRFNWSEKRMKGRHDEHSKLVIDAVNIPHWYIWTVLTMGYFSWKCWSWLQLDEIKIMTASLSYWIFPSGQKRTWFQILKCIDFQKAKIGEKRSDRGGEEDIRLNLCKTPRSCLSHFISIYMEYCTLKTSNVTQQEPRTNNCTLNKNAKQLAT